MDWKAKQITRTYHTVDGKKNRQIITKFNENGWETEKIDISYLNFEGTLITTYEYEYHPNGEVKRQLRYIGNELVDETQFDEQGYMTRTIEHEALRDDTKYSYRFNDAGQIATMYIHEEDNITRDGAMPIYKGRHEQEYDKKGRLKLVRAYVAHEDGTEELEWTERYKYDRNDNLVDFMSIDGNSPKDIFRQHCIYELDELGRKTKKTEIDSGKDKGKFVTRYEYKGDAPDWCRRIHHDGRIDTKEVIYY